MGTGVEATLRNGRNCGVNGTIDPDADPARELDHACNDHTSELSALSISDGGDCEAVLATDVSKTKQASFTSDGNDIITLEAFTLSSLRTPVCNLRKKLLILDLNGLLVDVVSRPPKDFKADIRIGKQASELYSFLLYCSVIELNIFNRLDPCISFQATFLSRFSEFLLCEI